MHFTKLPIQPWKVTLDFSLLYMISIDNRRFLKSKKSASLLCSAVNHKGACTTQIFIFIAHIFDYQACSSLLSPLPSVSAVGLHFSLHEPMLPVISLQFYSVHSQGYSSTLLRSPLPPLVRLDLHALQATPGTSFRGKLLFSRLFPGCCCRKCTRMHQEFIASLSYPFPHPHTPSIFQCLLFLPSFLSFSFWGSSSVVQKQATFISCFQRIA